MASLKQELVAIQEKLRAEIAMKQLEIEAVSTTIAIVSREEETTTKGGTIAVAPAPARQAAAPADPKGQGWAEKIPSSELKEALAGAKPRW